MKQFTVYSFLLAWLAGINGASAQDSSGVRLVGTLYNYWDVGHSVAVAGDFACVAAGYTGLRLVDISDPGQPQEVGYCETPGKAYGVVAVDNIAYVAWGKGADPFNDAEGGLRIVEITDPARPRERGFLDMPDEARALAVSGNFAYIADYHEGLRVVDVSDPAHPRETAFYDMMLSVTDVAVAGNFAYIIHDSRITAVDISNPDSLTSVGNMDLETEALGVAATGDFVFVVADSRLLIMNISDPARLHLVGSQALQGFGTEGVSLEGNYAWVTSYSGLEIIDISNPEQPRAVGFFEAAGAKAVTVVRDRAFITAGNGLEIADVSDPARPREAGYFDRSGVVQDIAVAENFLYVSAGKEGLRIADISNPSQPREVGFLRAIGLLDEAKSIATAGDLVFVATLLGMKVVDVSNPAQPQEIGFFESGGFQRKGLAVENDYAYLTNGGLYVVDISNPEQPQEVGFLETPGWALDVTVSGNHAYIADGIGGLRLVDISDPTQPREVGSQSELWECVSSVEVSEEYAYIASYRQGLRMVDVSDPADPREIGFQDTPGWAEGVAIAGNNDLFHSRDPGGNYAYVADSLGGLRVVNVSNPANLHETGFYQKGSKQALSVVVGPEGLIYVADAFSLSIYDAAEARGIPSEIVLQPNSIILHPAFPNPFNSTTLIGYDLPTALPVSIRVYELTGRSVATLAEGYYKAGRHNAVWNAGASAAGLYLVKLKTPGSSEVRKVTIVR